MKKILFAAIIASVITSSVSAAWLSGTINNVSTYGGDMLYITVGSSSKRVDPALSAEAKKIVSAIALTAFASGATVKVRYSETTSGTWDAIQLIK